MSVRTLLNVLVLGLIASRLTGCLPLPLKAGDTSQTRLNIDSAVPDFIVVGKTSRADLLLVLGEPDGKSAHGEQLVYTRVRSKGGVLSLVVGMYPGVGGISAERMNYRRLIVRFDDQGVVAEAHFDSATCWETSLSGVKCADVQGADLASVAWLNTGETTTPDAFPGFYWFPGVQGFSSFRGSAGFSSKAFDEAKRHVSGILVVGQSYVYFFPADADRETPPLLKLAYDEIEGAYLDRLWGSELLSRVVLTRNNGACESFGVWDLQVETHADPKLVEIASELVESRSRAAVERH